MMAWERRSATYATYNLKLPNDIAWKAALRLETETNIYLPERKYATVSYTYNHVISFTFLSYGHIFVLVNLINFNRQ